MIDSKQLDIDKMAQYLKTAGDPKRLKILCVIFHFKHICVSDIAKEMNEEVANISHHLGVMSKKGLIEAKRNGKCIFYSFADKDFARDLKKLICKYK